MEPGCVQEGMNPEEQVISGLSKEENESGSGIELDIG